jgi:hypothetical protein
MSTRMIFGVTMAVMSLIFATGCTHEGKKKPLNEESSKTLADLGRSSFITVEFEPGQSNLSQKNLESLKQVTRMADQSRRSIEDIKVLAWSDEEYPKAKEHISVSQVILAKERGSMIKNYLEKELKFAEKIDAINMAKRSRSSSGLFTTREDDIKNALEASGPTTTKNNDGKLSYNKASKAIVIIDYSLTR